MLDEQVDPNNAPASSQASLTSSGERHLSRGQRHAGGGGKGGTQRRFRIRETQRPEAGDQGRRTAH